MCNVTDKRAFNREGEIDRRVVAQFELEMDSVSRVMDMMENLPDPLVYSIIALFTTGAVYSSIHHAKNWRPRKAKRVKLKGADGKKIEDCTPPT